MVKSLRLFEERGQKEVKGAEGAEGAKGEKGAKGAEGDFLISPLGLLVPLIPLKTP